jgi:hypothetical protein
VYARLWVLLCAADRVLPTAALGAIERPHRRRTPLQGTANPRSRPRNPHPCCAST